MLALKTRSNSLAGLTLDAVLSGETAPPPPPSPPPQETQRTRRTLLDIIREEQFEGDKDSKDRTTWKTFREKLRLKRAGAAWTASHYIPFADIDIPTSKHNRKNHRFSHNHPSHLDSDDEKIHVSDLISTVPMSDPPGSARRVMFTRGSSMRVGSSKNPDDYADVSMPGDGPSSRCFRPQLSRHDSVRDHGDGQDEITRRQPVVKFVEERTMSAREAVAAQEASEAEAAAAAGDSSEEENEMDGSSAAAEAKPMTMSLMDLLEETDRQMGLTGSRYAMDEDEEGYEDEYEEEEEDGEDEGEFECCVCAVNVKGAAFTPCGHTFCKLCSKELAVQKGHCPVCITFVVEFLDIF